MPRTTVRVQPAVSVRKRHSLAVELHLCSLGREPHQRGVGLDGSLQRRTDRFFIFPKGSPAGSQHVSEGQHTNCVVCEQLSHVLERVGVQLSNVLLGVPSDGRGGPRLGVSGVCTPDGTPDLLHQKPDSLDRVVHGHHPVQVPHQRISACLQEELHSLRVALLRAPQQRSLPEGVFRVRICPCKK